MIDTTGRVPNGYYQHRITEAKIGQSKSSGATQITVEGEIIAPDVKRLGDLECRTAGKKWTVYLTFTDKATARCLQTLAKFEVLPGDGEDTHAFATRAANELKNKVFTCLTKSSPEFEREDLTPEEVAAGKKPWEADTIKDPVTNQPVIKMNKVEVNLDSLTGPVAQL